MPPHDLLVVIALLLCALPFSLRADASSTIIRGTDQFEFSYRVQLPEFSRSGRVWIPLARTDAFQVVTRESITTASWETLEEKDFGNQVLFLSAGPEKSGQTVEIRYRVERMEKPVYAWDGDPSRHLRPERLVPVNETFRSIATDVTRGKRTGMERGRAIYDHVLERMRYDKSGEGWGRGDAVFACDVRTGNCTDFHAYFIALCRAVEIPARFAIGFTIPSDRDEGEIGGYHCWAEFFADGTWVPVDISEAAQHPELADYYFGHHPANRFELTVGRDLVVEPGAASGPFNFLVYPLVEVDGKPVAVETEFVFRRIRP